MAGDIWKCDSCETFRGGFPLYLRILTVILMLDITHVNGYQCRRNWCNAGEYCCGEDLCCDYLTGYWYIWMVAGVVIFTIVLMCCWGRYKTQYSEIAINARNSKGYIPVTEISPSKGTQYFVYQQPEPAAFDSVAAARGYFYMQPTPHIPPPPEHEMRRYQGAQYYPPPYDYIERRPAPSAPPPPSN